MHLSSRRLRQTPLRLRWAVLPACVAAALAALYLQPQRVPMRYPSATDLRPPAAPTSRVESPAVPQASVPPQAIVDEPAEPDPAALAAREAADEGARLFAERRYALALRYLEPAAAAGYAHAQYQLGFLHWHGFGGVERNDVLAVQWLRRAADQGELDGQNLLGTAFREGRGVEQDHAAALAWYGSAADQGLLDAWYNLGFMHQQGYGLPRAPATAAGWYLQAARQGHAMSQLALGRLYESGEGVDRDLAAARYWYTRAAAADNEYARLALQRLDRGAPAAAAP